MSPSDGSVGLVDWGWGWGAEVDGGQGTPLLALCWNYIIICSWRHPPSHHNQYPSLGTCYGTTKDILQRCPHTHHTHTFYQSIVLVNYAKATDKYKAWQTNLHDTLIFIKCLSVNPKKGVNWNQGMFFLCCVICYTNQNIPRIIKRLFMMESLSLCLCSSLYFQAAHAKGVVETQWGQKKAEVILPPERCQSM